MNVGAVFVGGLVLEPDKLAFRLLFNLF